MWAAAASINFKSSIGIFHFFGAPLSRRFRVATGSLSDHVHCLTFDIVENVEMAKKRDDNTTHHK